MLNRAIKRFWDDHRGYVIALTLIAMPLLLGFSLIVIDVGRSANLHTDLQNAVDAMALAGARELDGRDNAIERAQEAIENLANTAAFGEGGEGMSLGSYITVSYDAGDDAASTVTVRFLKGIPGDGTFAGDDDDPITEAMVTTDSNEAGYAWVTAKDQAMQTIFPLPVGLNRDTINVSANAVAAYRVSACDVTPIFICNPYENPGGGNAEEAADLLHTNFAAGNLYGRQIELHNNNNVTATAGPGNFGFLETLGKGADALADALALGKPGVCYKQDDLTTEPGEMRGKVEHATNTRFGLYGAEYKNVDGDWHYRPAPNVRMAQTQDKKACETYTQAANAYDAVPLGYGTDMEVIPGGGGRISKSNNWNLNLYWDISHSGQNPSPLKSNPNYTPPLAPVAAITEFSSSYPGGVTPSGAQPSAYDVYNYEIGNPTLLTHMAPNDEKGSPQCHKGYNLADYPDSKYGNRREIFAAIINCADQGIKGRLSGVEAVAFARMFLTKPVVTDGSDSHMTLELVDITGKGGRGTLDEFLREEAELVR
ncbi:Tad domain-containing protein [Ensifer sesbaniae]|uniref:TadE/TadG family type IV pilus assembly protein n=1 Tax=Ensifer sesbaniae TaxID=1214071 RepID=UPI002001D32E|nr:Tad domain-containing protein [Ensifer sesbaniae]